MANSALSVANLDFSDIKSNLKTYLRSQTAFKDFDFEGSNLSVLIDILSYNTYMNSYYLNMVAAEGFIDSAQLRDSVVSHAKTLNSLPPTPHTTHTSSPSATACWSHLVRNRAPARVRFSINS